MMTAHTKTLDRAQRFSFDLDERILDLELIAAWTHDLRERMWGDEGAELDLDNIDNWVEPNIDALAAEAHEHRLACKGVRA
jgi:hypothetical protein